MNKLFFGVDISAKSVELLDSFLAVSKLNHSDTVIRQSSIQVTMQMKSNEQGWASKHLFTFSESPLPDLKIKEGIIELTIGEAGDTKKLLNLNLKLQFGSKEAVTKYFEKLKQLFTAVSTRKRIENDKDLGQMAQFSTRKKTDKGFREIALFLYQSAEAKRYEIILSVLQ